MKTITINREMAKAISHEVRWRMLIYLNGRDLSIYDVTLEFPEVRRHDGIRHHLRILIGAGLVKEVTNKKSVNSPAEKFYTAIYKVKPI